MSLFFTTGNLYFKTFSKTIDNIVGFSEVYLFGKTSRKIYWNLQVHTIPISFQQNTELLSTTKCKNWNQNLTQNIQA